MFDPEIVQEILLRYRLPRDGVHGVSHWGRVLENGQRMAERNGADLPVVQHFAIFHDAMRVDEGEDPDHGLRGAALVDEFRPRLALTDAQVAELKYACCAHTDGATEGSLTVRTCWDADRLDLWRVGISPRLELLCTEEGRSAELLAWSRPRSSLELMPACALAWL